MHTLFLGLVASITLMSPAISAGTQSELRTSYHYSGCVCRFGYGGDACQTDVACTSEGGSCTRSCAPPQSDYSRRD
jgi:hypothetical protein